MQWLCGEIKSATLLFAKLSTVKKKKKKTEQTKPEIHHLLLHMSEFSNETFLLQEKALEKVIGSREKRCHPRD